MRVSKSRNVHRSTPVSHAAAPGMYAYADTCKTGAVLRHGARSERRRLRADAKPLRRRLARRHLAVVELDDPVGNIEVLVVVADDQDGLATLLELGQQLAIEDLLNEGS